MVCGFDHRRKHCCSLKYGRKLAKGLFKNELANSMADIVTGLTVANAELKHEGQVKENEADKMPPALFEFMCECTMHDENALRWAMSVLQWSLMVHVQTIDDLVFRSFTMGSETIHAKFNQTKMTQTGSKTTSKHCYANPFNVSQRMTQLTLFLLRRGHRLAVHPETTVSMLRSGLRILGKRLQYSFALITLMCMV
jgi:hypothetical protein